MSHRDADSDGGEDENGGFALGTIFTVSREPLPSMHPYHQHLRVIAFLIAILPTILFPLTTRTRVPASVIPGA